MSLTGIRKDILELKRIAALEKKRLEDNWIKNLTDEELQEELDKELANLGFKSEDELYEAALKYFAENGLQTIFNNDYALHNYLFEQPEEIIVDFILKHGNTGEAK